MIRQPVVAGSFYPADPIELKKQISCFLSQVPSLSLMPGNLRMLLVPHAGYDFSAPTASHGFYQLKSKKYSRVVILGPSHQTYFIGASLSSAISWQTPFGQIEVDQEFNQRLVGENQKIFFGDQEHQSEHCLEVELPFLQTVLSNFQIVPILLGDVNQKFCQHLAKELTQNEDLQTLVVISSDFSHYPPAEVAEKVDQQIIQSILTGNPKDFIRKIETEINQGYPGLETCACGEKAILTALFLVEKLSIQSIKLLNYSHSGQISGDNSRVVGYASIGFYE